MTERMEIDRREEPLIASQPAIAPHILVVDDDPSVRQMLADYLTEYELRVTTLANGRGIARVMDGESIDLVLLDLRLPGEDGMHIARRLREDSDIPLIMLTARKDEADRVMGLELGADDYVTKPFSLRELLARIRALLRRSRRHEQRTIGQGLQKVRAYRFLGYELSVRLRRLSCPGEKILHLTNREFSLLAALLASPQRILSRDQLLTRSRLHNDEVYERSIDVQVGRLRRKIDPARTVELIRTERGAGYVFVPPVEIVCQRTSSTSS